MAIKLIESPTVHQRTDPLPGEPQGRPVAPFEGEFLGQRFVRGVAHVDEAATVAYTDPQHLTVPKCVPVWQVLRDDWGMRDVTPDPDAAALPDAALEALTAPAPKRA